MPPLEKGPEHALNFEPNIAARSVPPQKGLAK
jgi:hypothetical protein